MTSNTFALALMLLMGLSLGCEPAGSPQPNTPPKPKTTKKTPQIKSTKPSHPSLVPSTLRVNHPLADKCDGGNYDACVSLASKLLIGSEVKRSVSRAQAYFAGACHKKHRAGCHGWAVLLRDIVRKPEAQTKALALFKANCAGSYWASCGNAADMMARGEGGQRQAKEALTLAQKHCDTQKEPYSCMVAGRLLTEGKRFGIESNIKQAAQYLDLACQKRSWKSCTRLGRLYEQGREVDRDPRKARTLYARACQNDFRANGCSELANMMRVGTGGSANVIEAYKMDEKACKFGYQLSCISQAEAMLKGQGTKVNKARGLAILKQHCDKKNRLACLKLKQNQ